MSALGTTGKAIVGLGIGGLAVLAGVKAVDDRRVDGIWRRLEQPEGLRESFTEEMVSELPGPARRYFLHAIQPGTNLASRLHWRYSGSLNLGKGMPRMCLRAEQILAKERGFVWRATASKGPLSLTAADHYLDGDGRMRIALFGLIPVINATGPDLSKSALARLLIEGIALPPAFLPGPHVRIDGIDESRFTVTVSLQGETTPITLTVDQEGRSKEITMQRWGNQTADGSYRYIPYGGTMQDERTFGGYTIPTRMAVGWWYGTEQFEEAIRVDVDWAQLY